MAESSLATLAAVAALITALVVLFTAISANIAARKAKQVAHDVQKDVQQIVVNVDGRLSELLEVNQILTARVYQLTASLETSDTTVPEEPTVVKVIVADSPMDPE